MCENGRAGMVNEAGSLQRLHAHQPMLPTPNNKSDAQAEPIHFGSLAETRNDEAKNEGERQAQGTVQKCHGEEV